MTLSPGKEKERKEEEREERKGMKRRGKKERGAGQLLTRDEGSRVC